MLSVFNFRNRRTTQPKLQRSALVICLTFMALFAYSTSNVLAASATPNNVVTAGNTVITKPIDASLLGNIGTNCSAVTEIPSSECDVLVLLFANTNGSGWTQNSGWNVTNAPCSWHGVLCSGGHVININLNFNNLSGSIPLLGGLIDLQILSLSFNTLSGSIPSLNGLTSLQFIDLSVNTLSGSIPSLNGVTGLQNLNLFNNALSGSIPSLSGLTSLKTLDLSNNKLSGSIPSLSGLTSLQNLDLFNNTLSGTIPLLNQSIGLHNIYLDGNKLSGSIPSLTGLTSLQFLSLSSNQLSGQVPLFSGLPNLVQLDLSNNTLNGSLPSFSGLTSLQYLYLNDNQFIGNVPDIPTSLSRLFIQNNLLNGTIPHSLSSTVVTTGNLRLCGTGNVLTSVDTSVNSFIAARLTGWPGYCGAPPTTTHFSVTGFSSPVAAGTASTITVTALNASNGIATNYSGTVAITSSDANAVLPVLSQKGDRFGEESN